MNKKLLFLFLLVITLTSAFMPKNADAALTRAMVRPDRLKAATAPGPILVTAVTAENVTENGVKITAGSAWSISGTASNFTVSTAGLPSGVTAWPGIGTATNVTGNAITFPAGNIAQGTEYGFYITGGVPTNPSVGTGLSYVWTVATLVGGVESSSIQAGVAVVSNDQINVNATVPALSTYFSADLTSLDSGTQFQQNTTLSYQITYGSNLSNSTPLTLEAEWTQGTIQGAGSPSVDIVEYVLGSATDAYGSTPPVVDISNRKITWTISSFPANTQNQTVTFKLRTTSTFTSSLPVTFSVIGRITDPAVTPDSTVDQTYQFYSPSPTPSPQQTAPTTTAKKACDLSCATDTECDSGYCNVSIGVGKCRNRDNPNDSQCAALTTPVPSTTPPVTSPTPSPVSERVEVREITSNSITLSVALSEPGEMNLQYGLTPDSMDTTLTSSGIQRIHTIKITGLRPKTRYFIKLFSDIITIETAEEIEAAVVQPQHIFISSQGIHLYNSFENSARFPIVIPNSSPFEVTIFFDNSETIDQVSLYTMAGNEMPLFQTGLTETQPGVFSGKLTSPNSRGWHNLIVQVGDLFGNLKEYPISELHVTSPLRVLHKETGQPVEHAEITIWKKNPKNLLWEILPAPSILPSNPLFTNFEGVLPLTLPLGIYQLEIKAIGYQPQTFEFTLGDEEEQTFPEIRLLPIPWSLTDMIARQWQTVNEIYRNFQKAFSDYAHSHATFQVVSYITLAILTLLSLMSFSERLSISIFQLITHTKLHTHFLFHPFIKDWLVTGKIIDEAGKAVSKAEIAIFSNDQQVLSQTASQRNGTFYFKGKEKLKNVRLMVTAPGYHAQEKTVDINPGKPNSFTISLSKHTPIVRNTMEHLKFFGQSLLNSLFEVLLISSFALEALYFTTLDPLTVAPFFAISTLNLVLWLQHLYSGMMHKWYG
jgi:hypothetical protein